MTQNTYARLLFNPFYYIYKLYFISSIKMIFFLKIDIENYSKIDEKIRLLFLLLVIYSCEINLIKNK